MTLHTVERPTWRAARELARRTTAPCVSIVQTVTAGFGAHRENLLRHRQAAADAAQALERRGLDSERIDAWHDELVSLADLLEDLPHATGSLALFSTPDPSAADSDPWPATPARAFALSAPPEGPAGTGSGAATVQVGRSFHLRPLLRELRLDRPFLVLALSEGALALYRYARDARGLTEVPLPDAPRSLRQALGRDLTERALQHHGSRGDTVWHGQGGAADERQVDRRRFYRAVGKALGPVLERAGGGPVLLATDPAHEGELRKAWHGPPPLGESLHVNPAGASAAELLARARRCMAERVEREDAEARREVQRSGKAVEGLPALVEAACAGRVRRLWLALDARVPGRLREQALRFDPGGEDDVLDELTALVLRLGGEVCVDPGPAHERPLLAELR